MTAIHPMAVIDRLNEVFGVGWWNFKTEYIICNPFVQKTKNGDRGMFMSAVKGTLEIPRYNIHIEQFGGSSNDDMGDALKGGATDALTKCASYLGVGASIYKGQGNVEPPEPQKSPVERLAAVKTLAELKAIWNALTDAQRHDPEAEAMKDEMKEKLSNNS